MRHRDGSSARCALSAHLAPAHPPPRLGTAACTVMCLLVDFLFLLLRRTLRPWDWQVVQEYQTRHKTLWVPRWAVYGGPKNEDTV